MVANLARISPGSWPRTTNRMLTEAPELLGDQGWSPTLPVSDFVKARTLSCFPRVVHGILIIRIHPITGPRAYSGGGNSEMSDLRSDLVVFLPERAEDWG
jgi:hypothetical protein